MITNINDLYSLLAWLTSHDFRVTDKLPGYSSFLTTITVRGWNIGTWGPAIGSVGLPGPTGARVGPPQRPFPTFSIDVNCYDMPKIAPWVVEELMLKSGLEAPAEKKA